MFLPVVNFYQAFNSAQKTFNNKPAANTLASLLVCIFCLMLLANPASANLPGVSNTATTTSNDELKDPLGRETPRGTVLGYLDAMAKEDLEKAAAFFDLSYLPENQQLSKGKRLAANLQTLLNQKGSLTPSSLLSNHESGVEKDNLDANLDKVGNFKFDDKDIPVIVERIVNADGKALWFFSKNETLSYIPSTILLELKPPLIDSIMPAVLNKYKWGGVPVGQWLFMFLLIVLSYVLARLLTALLAKSIRTIWRNTLNKRQHKLINAFALPIRLYMAVWILIFSAEHLDVSIIIRQYFSQATTVVAWIAVLILLWQLIDVFASFGEKRMHQRKNQGGLSAVLFFQRSAKFALAALGFITILKALGVDVTTGLAAFGIGGLALALGAQKTIENLVGSLNIIFDQPVRVGDFCQVGEIKGTIEKIGMRSTRIRTLNRTLITIPNGDFSAQQIENYTHRDSFIYHPILTLRYETSPDQMRYVLVKIREMLYAHPRIDPEPARVRFTEFGASALHIEILAYITAVDYHESLEVQEDLNLRIADIVKDSGSGFAYPSQTLYIAQDGGIDAERTQHAEQQVNIWRKQGELHIPSFDSKTQSKLKDSIEYPAAGSSAGSDKKT